MPQKRLQLTTKLLISLSALIIGATLLSGYGIGQARISDLEQEQQQTLTVETKIAATRLGDYIDSLRRDAGFLAAVPAVQGIVRSAIAGGIDPESSSTEQQWRDRLAATFVALLQQRSDYLQARFIGLADDDKEIVRVAREGGQVAVVADAALQAKSGRDYVGRTMHLQPGQVYLSPIALEQQNGQILVPHVRTMLVAIPIYTDAGEPFGLMVINVDIGVILDRVAAGIPSPIRTYIVNASGDYLYHADPERAFGFDLGTRYLVQDDFPILRQFFSPGADFEDRALYQGQSGVVHPALVHLRKVAFDPLRPERYLAVVLVRDESTLVRDEQLLLWRNLALAAIVSLVLIVIMLLLIRRFTAPLSALVTAAEHMVVGNYEYPLPTSNEREIAALGRAFTHMQGAVRQREQQLKEANDSLESQADEQADALRHSDQELREQKRLLQAIADGIDDGVIVVSNERRFLVWNRTAELLIGSGPSEVPPEQWGRHYGLYHADGTTPLDDSELPVSQALAGHPVKAQEIFVRNAFNGEGNRITVSAKPLRGEDQTILGCVLTLHAGSGCP